MGRRIMAEVVATVAALAAVTVYMQLQDSTSTLRLRIAELGDTVTEWRAQAKVQRFLDSIKEG